MKADKYLRQKGKNNEGERGGSKNRNDWKYISTLD